MKQALELFESKSYLKAEKLFLNPQPGDELHSLKYLFLISKALGRPDENERFNAFLRKLGESEKVGRDEELLNFIQKHKRKVSASNFALVLESLWSCGRIEEFNRFSKAFWSQIVERKLYSWAKTLYKVIGDRNPNLLANHFSYLLYVCETGDGEEIERVAAHIIDLVENSWNKIKTPKLDRANCVNKLISLLEGVPEKEARTEEKILILKRILARERGDTLGTRDLIEYLIYFKNDMPRLVQLLADGVVSERDKIRDVLTSKAYAEQVGALPFSLKKYLRPESVYSKTNSVSTKQVGGQKGPDLLELDPGGGIRLKNDSIRFARILSEPEKSILSRIRAGDPDLCKKQNVVAVSNSLLGVGFYSAALEIMKLNEGEPRLYFARCHALLELGRHHELRDYAFEVLASLQGPEERLPFLHMAASALLREGQSSRALNVLAEVAQIDPNFRNTQELLKLAKA